MGKKRRTKQKARRGQVLRDHQRIRKQFIPPFLATFPGKLGYVRWIDDLLPEVVWIALLLDSLPASRGVEVALRCAQETNRVVAPQKARSFAFISEYYAVTTAHTREILQGLSNSSVLDDLRSSLMPLVSLYGECPLGFLFDERARIQHRIDLETATERMKRAVRDCHNRRSRPAMLVQATALYLMMATGKMVIRKGMELEKIERILDYPDTEESKGLASLVRAALNACIPNEEGARGWCSCFWRHGYDISVCEFHEYEVGPRDEISKTKLREILEASQRYRTELFEEVRERWVRAPLDLARPIRGEVLGGLIARQARLATALAGDPNLWSVDIGRILLRCMVDTHITLTWLARKGNEEDYEHFVEHGLGQEKLLLEHLSLRLDEADGETATLREHIEGMREWINSQLLMDLLPVNVGAWTRKSPREMAEETNCLDIYNLSYSPLSSIVHGMWNTIARFNLQFCTNPLHRFHRVPRLHDTPVYMSTAEYAVEIMNESFRTWKHAIGVEPLESSASERFRKALEDWQATM